jgi:hypothetical protein
MKYLKFIAVILVLISACKKEDAQPRLSFSEEERNWFIYQVGQEFKFKSPTGDSIIFVVDSVTDYFHQEHSCADTAVLIDEVETYEAHLTAVDDFINVAFYKSSQCNSDANKLNQSIGWHKVAGQFVEIENIKNQVPFIGWVINNTTYNKVSAVYPMSYTHYPWTKWITAYYDQNAGFIILIDINGVYWERQ